MIHVIFALIFWHQPPGVLPYQPPPPALCGHMLCFKPRPVGG